MPIPATLVTGSSAASRERAIAARLAADDPGASRTALILEGLPSGADLFAGQPELTVARIAPGCVCCAGNLTLKVTLNRLLRQRPDRLFIGIADTRHLDAILAFLRGAPYDDWISLGEPLSAD